MPRSEDIRLDLAEFRLLRALFQRALGALFAPSRRASWSSGDSATGSRSSGSRRFGEYYQFLRFDERGAPSLEEALDLVTINETYFFREAYQLRAFKDEILPALKTSLTRASGRTSACGARAARRVRRSIRSPWSRASPGSFPGAPCASSGATSRAAACRTREEGASTGRRRSAPCRPSPAPLLRRAARRRARRRRPARHLPVRPRQPDSTGLARSVVGRVDVIFCRNVLHLFRRDVARRQGDRDVLRPVAAGRVPPARALGVAAQRLDGVRAGAPARGSALGSCLRQRDALLLVRGDLFQRGARKAEPFGRSLRSSRSRSRPETGRPRRGRRRRASCGEPSRAGTRTARGPSRPRSGARCRRPRSLRRTSSGPVPPRAPPRLALSRRRARAPRPSFDRARGTRAALPGPGKGQSLNTHPAPGIGWLRRGVPGPAACPRRR